MSIIDVISQVNNIREAHKELQATTFKIMKWLRSQDCGAAGEVSGSIDTKYEMSFYDWCGVRTPPRS